MNVELWIRVYFLKIQVKAKSRECHTKLFYERIYFGGPEPYKVRNCDFLFDEKYTDEEYTV